MFKFLSFLHDDLNDLAASWILFIHAQGNDEKAPKHPVDTVNIGGGWSCELNTINYDSNYSTQSILSKFPEYQIQEGQEITVVDLIGNNQFAEDGGTFEGPQYSIDHEKQIIYWHPYKIIRADYPGLNTQTKYQDKIVDLSKEDAVKKAEDFCYHLINHAKETSNNNVIVHAHSLGGIIGAGALQRISKENGGELPGIQKIYFSRTAQGIEAFKNNPDSFIQKSIYPYIRGRKNSINLLKFIKEHHYTYFSILDGGNDTVMQTASSGRNFLKQCLKKNKGVIPSNCNVFIEPESNHNNKFGGQIYNEFLTGYSHLEKDKPQGKLYIGKNSYEEINFNKQLGKEILTTSYSSASSYPGPITIILKAVFYVFAATLLPLLSPFIRTGGNMINRDWSFLRVLFTWFTRDMILAAIRFIVLPFNVLYSSTRNFWDNKVASFMGIAFSVLVLIPVWGAKLIPALLAPINSQATAFVSAFINGSIHLPHLLNFLMPVLEALSKSILFGQPIGLLIVILATIGLVICRQLAYNIYYRWLEQPIPLKQQQFPAGGGGSGNSEKNNLCNNTNTNQLVVKQQNGSANNNNNNILTQDQDKKYGSNTNEDNITYKSLI